MEILLLSSTILVSITTKKIHKLYFINQLIKRDYKLENYNYDKKIMYAIPVINLGYVLKNLKKFNVSNINYLKNNNIIIPLTKKEKDLYNEYPNLITTLNINLIQNNKPNMIIVDLENKAENTFYITNEDDNYIINYTKGPISKLSKREQYEYLKEELLSLKIEDNPKIKIKKN